MSIHHYLRSLPLVEREALAAQVGTTGAYLNRIAYGNGKQPPGPKLARKLAVVLKGKLTLEEIRPDIWGEDPLPATNSSMEARQELVNQ
ncbi:hypothetical protein [uncultured Microbulbifer sp.]|uniref:hypothetical protein n=1 Tax=uncultured Microbulbifer sp. TaxID=348147 RepID=UPI002609AD8D|nr:hypothetical protein [uncultured Microbulbifer sp.]